MPPECFLLPFAKPLEDNMFFAQTLQHVEEVAQSAPIDLFPTNYEEDPSIYSDYYDNQLEAAFAEVKTGVQYYEQ